MKLIFIFCLSVTICTSTALQATNYPVVGPVEPDHMVKDGTGVQYVFPWKESEKTCEPVTEEVSAFKITCGCYGDKIAAVVSRAGIRIETVLLDSSDQNQKPNICSNLRRIIIPEKINSEVRVTYVWKMREQSQRCRMKKYKVKVEFRAYYGTVQNLEVEDIVCPSEVTKFLKSIGDPANFGVESLLGYGNEIVHDMDYHVEIDKYELLVTKPNGFSDLLGNGYKMICKTFARKMMDSKPRPPPGYPQTEGEEGPSSERYVHTGSIVFEGKDDIVLERFRADSCDSFYMNVNRKVHSPYHSEFTYKFRAIDGNCYSRHYRQTEQKEDLLKKTTIHRSKLQCVKCPRDREWTGEIKNQVVGCGWNYNWSVFSDWMRKKSGLDKDLEP